MRITVCVLFLCTFLSVRGFVPLPNANGKVCKHKFGSRLHMVKTDAAARDTIDKTTTPAIIPGRGGELYESLSHASTGTTSNSNSNSNSNSKKVKNLKKAPGQDLPEVLRSWNELQGLSERELLSNKLPSLERNEDALALAYRRYVSFCLCLFLSSFHFSSSSSISI